MFASSGYSYLPLGAFETYEDAISFAIDHESLLEIWLEDERLPIHCRPLVLGEGFVTARFVRSVTLMTKELGPQTMVRLTRIYALRVCRAVGLIETDTDSVDLSHRPPV